MTTTEARAHTELRDRLDHMRAVAAARGRVHAFIEAYQRHVEDDLLVALADVIRDAGGDEVELHLDDLRTLLGAEFIPGRDTKQAQPERVDDDDEDETGLHRAQAQAQRYPSPRGWDCV